MKRGLKTRPRNLAVVAVAFLFCDPVMDIQGRVLDEKGAPRANVGVALVCPPETWSRVEPRVLTDAAGRFAFEGLGCPTRSCRVRAQTQDGGTLSVELGPHCTGSTYHCRDSCAEATVELRL